MSTYRARFARVAGIAALVFGPGAVVRTAVELWAEQHDQTDPGAAP